MLLPRAAGRRRFKPPPAEIVPRLQVRSDDTEEKAVTRLQTHASNVAAVLGYYKDQLVELDGNRSMCARPLSYIFRISKRCAPRAALRAGARAASGRCFFGNAPLTRRRRPLPPAPNRRDAVFKDVEAILSRK